MDEYALETIELELALLIRRAIAISTNKSIGNLDRSAYLLLQQIASQGSAGVKALSEQFHLDISTVSRQAAALEQKEYVKRIPDSLDRRAYYLQITALGTKELIDYKNARKAAIAELLQSWSAEEAEMFGQLMKKFNRTFISSDYGNKKYFG
ncbi:MarR family transcriptional regulator [Paenibacillus sp. FSL H8-0548]|uniref:MarR family winged helix-turn-helix transcriptional regulator n=1 Tax=Paenibacillus sp. FSL H8-0548 TaxID=1920422 RepID=UPI00096CC5D4|nr:MarR family transcriptional regulator [Paenibacillus sp. FSL H8-0548]OMF18894.1 MarR family transcriptional regulator [Paenibacillus sp. FSL H8-0548]